MKKFAEKLALLVVGWEIQAVEPGQVAEGLLTLKLRKGDERRTVEIGATELGGWVQGCYTEIAPNQRVYDDADLLVMAVTDYVFSLSDQREEDLEPIEDPLHRRLGFRHKPTGLEWWAKLTAIKKSPQACLWQTSADRLLLAKAIVVGMGQASPQIIRERVGALEDEPIV